MIIGYCCADWWIIDNSADVWLFKLFLDTKNKVDYIKTSPPAKLMAVEIIRGVDLWKVFMKKSKLS